MELIRELLSIVTPNKLKHLRLLGQTAGRKGDRLVDDLYDLLSIGGEESDLEAAEILYQSSPSDSRYRKLKSVLKYRLIDLLFLIDGNQAKYREHLTAFQQANKYLAAARILMSRGAIKGACELFQKTLDIAAVNEFTDIAVQSLKHLRHHYGLIDIDWKRYAEYDTLLKRYLMVQAAEIRVEEYYILLSSRTFRRSAHRPKPSMPLVDLLREVDELLGDFDSVRLHYHGRLLKFIQFMRVQDYAHAAAVCREALDYYEAKPFRYRIGLSGFANNLLICCTQLRQFEEGWLILAKYGGLYEKGHYNWFNSRFLYLYLCLHSGQYQNAWSTYSEAVSVRAIKKLPVQEAEKWTIVGAYLHYLVSVGVIHSGAGVSRTSKFRVAKFVNEVPVYSADKRGYNIAILIIQILFLISQESWQVALDRVEALGKYRTRYLRKNAQFRSNCFIQMVMQIPVSGFHRKSVERRAAGYLEKLKSVPLEHARQPYEAELIPFEKLWEFALQSLGRRFVDNRLYQEQRNGKGSDKG